MKLVNWTPNNNIFDLFDNFDQHFNGIVYDNYKYKRPNVEIMDDEKGYFLSLDVPGIDKKNIDITIDHDIINIKAERKMHNENALYSEVGDCNYSRSFFVPDNADSSKIKAKCLNGIFMIEIPKLKKVKKDLKRITIS